MAGLTYDNNGTITVADGVTYSYDYANRISGTSTGVSIGYNGDGVRVSETVAGITTQYLVDEHNPTGYAQVVEEIRNGQVQTRYTYGHDLISQTMVGAGATSFYTYDGLGSVRALTNGAGAVTDRYTYDAFGTDIATSGTGTPNAYRFTGEQQDAALGMDYLRARYYQAGSGRFWTRDTWGLDQQHPQEWNRYVYVAADPVNGVDPSGLLLSIYGGQLKTSALPIIGISKALVWKIVFVTGLTAIALETNVLLSQRGRNNIRNYIVDEVQRVLPRGGDPCKILEEWYKAARAAGDTQLALDIKVAQKYFNCRAHR